MKLLTKGQFTVLPVVIVSLEYKIYIFSLWIVMGSKYELSLNGNSQVKVQVPQSFT